MDGDGYERMARLNLTAYFTEQNNKIISVCIRRRSVWKTDIHALYVTLIKWRDCCCCCCYCNICVLNFCSEKNAYKIKHAKCHTE